MLASPSPSPLSDYEHLELEYALQQQQQHQAAMHAHHQGMSSFPPPPADYDASIHSSLQGSAKRYRSAPAKSFQCTGYGDCRMVFSRSEHLARHIRKHTGERPFTCHCSKQFSRLDNLRQHAQTVHSAPEDKPLNERMMRALVTVNASMMAGVRGRRRYGVPPPEIPLPPQGLYPSSSTSYHYAGASPLPSPGLSLYPGGSPLGSPASGVYPSSMSNSPSPLNPTFGPAVHGSGYPLPVQMHAHGAHSLPASPSYATFPSSARAPLPHSHSHSYSHPHPQAPSPLYEYDGPDYFSAPSQVKQEQPDLEGFYPPNHSPRTHSISHHGLTSYASSSSLSSFASSPPSDRSAHSASPPSEQQYYTEDVGRHHGLPSPPHSPSYYGQQVSKHSQQPPAHQHASQYGWAEEDQHLEMSNAQYYAAIQAGGGY
ncbi:unnamed protein product [Mycena citricolor]|uniref:C2H2-type domain-containing protein n=1 Tax=Mycena citricolor TaxID=2018698 RepID=A0AAD2GUW8_9AGAR|nr:unnamed protein product [Mycena citricolor]